ncbi:MAG TPA: phosphatase PAP2 family protein [Vicinamibacterales bacterium]|nr:phosphatase PAP2 family protein [Vicinamibacterales bacterium]
MIRLGTAAMVMMLVAGPHSASAQTATTAPTTQANSSPPPAIDVPMPSWMSVFGDLPKDIRALPTRTNLFWLAGGGAAALAVHVDDVAITHAASSSDDLDPPLEAGALLGSGWVQFGGALAAFSIGKLRGHPALAQVGSDLVRAQFISGLMTQGLKVAVNRARPDGGRHSFPSGHTSETFASATVLQRWFGWRVGAPAYATAMYVATSRLQENHHYASDVIFGAAIGVVAGRSVTVGHGPHAFAAAPVVTSRGIGIEFARR